MTNKYIAIIATRVSTTNDNNGYPRALYIVSGLLENPAMGSDRLAIIEEEYKGRTALTDQFPTARKVDDIYISPQEYRRWVKVMKTKQELRDQEALEQYEEGRANQ